METPSTDSEHSRMDPRHDGSGVDFSELTREQIELIKASSPENLWQVLANGFRSAKKNEGKELPPEPEIPIEIPITSPLQESSDPDSDIYSTVLSPEESKEFNKMLERMNAGEAWRETFAKRKADKQMRKGRVLPNSESKE